MIPITQSTSLLMRIYERLTSPITNIFKSGLSLEIVALSFSLGIICGIFPITLITSLIGVLFSYIMKANIVACTAIVYVMTPLNLFLVIPFIRAGEILFQIDKPIQFSSDSFSSDFFGSLSKYGGAFTRAIVVWALLFIPITWTSYQILLITLRPIFKQRV